MQRAIEADRPSEIRTEPLLVGGDVGAYNNFWFDRGVRPPRVGTTGCSICSPAPAPESGRRPSSNPRGSEPPVDHAVDGRR